ncbi:MAG: hypothetical protein ACXIVL_07545 [Oceanicaulis sp.]
MIIRILAALVIAPVAAIAALQAAAMVMTPQAASGDRVRMAPSGTFEGETRAAQPYADGEAAAWLAAVLAGAGRYPLANADGTADLAALAAEAARGGDAAVNCQPAHVALACVLTRPGGGAYTFVLQNSEERGWVVLENAVRVQGTG